MLLHTKPPVADGIEGVNFVEGKFLVLIACHIQFKVFHATLILSTALSLTSGEPTVVIQLAQRTAHMTDVTVLKAVKRVRANR